MTVAMMIKNNRNIYMKTFGKNIDEKCVHYSETKLFFLPTSVSIECLSIKTAFILASCCLARHISFLQPTVMASYLSEQFWSFMEDRRACY